MPYDKILMYFTTIKICSFIFPLYMYVTENMHVYLGNILSASNG